MSNPNEENQSGTVFMGPLAYREERVDSIISAQLKAQWSEETETTYMENVRSRATAKVRAMLLQAKRRGDEIIAQAEVDATEIRNKAEMVHADAQKAHAEALEIKKEAQEEFDKTLDLATQTANDTMQEKLAQEQKTLGESTAVVLLSIHQQLPKIYDAWREELRLLTLEAIQVGTSWVANFDKEQILSSMLDECVSKLIDKKDYMVRVHPSDGALVTQVLGNSREKAWSMETSADLEPGSLEIESMHGMVKNDSKDRRKFVQGILDNLVLPGAKTGGVEIQSVTDTLMNEMQSNPLLAQASIDTQDDSQDDGAMQYLGQEIEDSPQDDNFNESSLSEDALSENSLGENNFTENDVLNNAPGNAPDGSLDNSPSDASMEGISPQNETDEISEIHEMASDDVALSDATANDAVSHDIENPANLSAEHDETTDELADTSEALTPLSSETIEPTLDSTDMEADNIVDEFLSDSEDGLELQANDTDSPSDSLNNSDDDSQNSLDTQTDDSVSLPPDVADDLLAEMGFAPTDSTPK